jgi:hypothetical protein
LRTKFTTNYFGNPRPYWNKDFDIGAYEIEDTQLKLSFLGDPNLTEVTFDVTSYGTHWEYDGIKWIKSTDQGLGFASVPVKPKQLLHEFEGMILKWMNRSITYPYPKIGSAFYKITNTENNDYIYLDLRDAITTYGPNVYIQYNFSLGKYQYYDGVNFQTVQENGSILRVWEITNEGNYNTSLLDSYREKCLIGLEKNNHPWLVWAPFAPEPVTYTLQREYDGGLWTPITTILPFEHEDITLTISGGGESVEDVYVQYKVEIAPNVETDPVGYTVLPIKEKRNGLESIKLSNQLMQNYPNPFNPSTVISFSIAKPEYVTLRIYDMLGREVVTLVNEKLDEGFYDITLKARDLASGIYIYKLNAGKFSEIKKMQLIK